MTEFNDVSQIIENINNRKIKIAAETLYAYCRFDNQPFTQAEAVEELQNFIELADMATLLKYPIMGDVLYYGLLIRLSDDVLADAVDKFHDTQFAKDCTWCIEKHRAIRDEANRNKLHQHHIEWLNGEMDYLYGSSLDDALCRNGYSLGDKSQIARWKVVEERNV